MDIQQINQRAAEVIKEFNPSGLVPFPFAEMADQLGNVKLLFLDDMPEQVSGAIFFQDEKFTIVVSTQKATVRQYFTAAHEFGHYFLHKDWLLANSRSGFVDYSDVVDGESMLLRPDEPPLSSESLLKEREANSFAAELIMPEDKVREYWELTQDITKTAKAFQVSQSAMAIRLERLGFVS